MPVVTGDLGCGELLLRRRRAGMEAFWKPLERELFQDACDVGSGLNPGG
jgi:hypothetical protein